MSTTPSQFAPNIANRPVSEGSPPGSPRDATDLGPRKALPRAAKGAAPVKPPESAEARGPRPPPAPPSTKTRKGTRKSRLHKEIKELKKAKKELWSMYITRKFQVLYETHLSTFRLSEDRVKDTKARDKRAMLRLLPGYNEALDAFRRDKEVFIEQLVTLSRQEGGDLAIDQQATKFLSEHE